MAVIFRKLETDLTTVRLDLNAGFGAATGLELLHDPDLGTIPAGGDFLQESPTPDAVQVGVGRGMVPVRFRLIAKHTSYASLLALAQSLATELDTPGPYQFNPSGETARYFDAFRAEIPGLLRGQELALYKIINLLRDVDGLPVTLWRLPYLYRALVTGTPTSVSNDPAASGKRMTINVQGSAPTRAIIKMAPEVGSTLVQARVARRSYGSLSTFRSSWFVQAESGTLGTDTTSVANASASGGNAARITFATPSMVRRGRWTISPADKTGIQGSFRVFARLQLAAGSVGSTWRVMGKWSPSSADPVSFNMTRDPITLTYPSGIATQFYMVDLGTVYVERGVGTTYGLTLELWAARDLGDGNIEADHLCLFPAGPTPTSRPDQMTTLAVRGFRDDFGAGVERWEPAELVTPTSPAGETSGELLASSVRLSRSTDSAGVPPNAGFTIANGRHSFKVDATVRRDSASRSIGTYTLADLVLRNITAGSDIASKAVGFTASGSTSQRRTFELTVDRPGTNPNVQPQVRANANVGTTADVKIHEMSHTFTRTVGSTERLWLDGEYGIVANRPASFISDASDVFIDALSQSGAFVDLYPGDNELCFDWGEIPPAGTEDVDARGPLAASTIDRDVTVTVSYYPRDTA